MKQFPKSIPICGIPVSGFFEKDGTYLRLQTCTVSDNLPPIRENNSLFVFVTDGAGIIDINGVRFSLLAGSFLWLQSYHTFTIACTSEEALRLQVLLYDYPLSSFLAFQAPNAMTTQAIMQISPVMQLFGEQAAKIDSIFHEFAELDNCFDPGSSLIKVSLLGQLADFFVRNGIMAEPELKPEEQPLGWQAILYIGFHFSEPLTAASTAKALETSADLLNRELRLISGSNFSYALNQTRTCIAAGSLLYENISLSYISERAGFPSEIAFYRIFRQHMDMTPLEYRAKMLSSSAPVFRGMIMNQLLMEVMNHFYDKFQESFDLKDTSQELYLSESVIRKLIQERFGATYKDFMFLTRLRHAAALLLTTELPVLDIAVNVGFNCTRSFSRAFLSEYHMTPSHYRSAYRGRELVLSAEPAEGSMKS